MKARNVWGGRLPSLNAGVDSGRRVAWVVATAALGCSLAQAQDDQPRPPQDSVTAPEASQPTSGALEEIVVTAQKRTERLQDIPASVAVVNADQMRSAGVQQLEDIGKLAPSISLTGATGNLHSTISVRGIFTNAISPGVPTAAGVVVDDIPQPPEARGFNELSDIERIEVLNGPQSTISARNAAAGLINIVTRAPSMTFAGDVSTSITTDDEIRTSAFVTGPLGDTLAGSLSMYYSDWAGNVDNVSNGRDLGRDSKGARGKLLWSPNENFDVTGTAYYQRLKEDQGVPVYQHFEPGAVFLGIPGFTPDAAVGPFAFDDENSHTGTAATGAFQRSTSSGGSVRARLGIGELDLISITGYQREDVDASQDIFGISVSLAPGWCGCQTSTVNTRSWSQEFRLVSPDNQPLTYVAGLVYLDTTVDYDFVREIVAPFSRTRTAGLKNYAAYGRGTYHVNDAFDITAGVRYNVEKIDYELFDRTERVRASDSASDSVVVGDLSLQYRLLPDVMAYFRYARGYQGQVYDLDAPLVVDSNGAAVPYEPVSPEDVNSFELGLKSEWWDGKLMFNLAVFDAVYSDYQAQRAVAVQDSISLQLLNVGEVETRGVEVSGRLLASSNTRLDFSATFLDPKINSFADAPCFDTQTAAQGCVNGTQNLNGQRMSHSPDWRFAAGIEQGFATESLPFELSARLDGVYQTAVNYDLFGNPFTRQDGYGTLNLSLGADDNEGKYNVTLFVNNVLDKHYVFDLTDFVGFWGQHAVYTRSLPRDWERFAGARFTYRF